MNSVKTLIKDLFFILLGYAIWSSINNALMGGQEPDILLNLLGSGIILGWRALPDHDRDYYDDPDREVLIGFIIRLMISLLLGVFLMPIVILRDVINVVYEYKRYGKNQRSTVFSGHGPIVMFLNRVTGGSINRSGRVHSNVR